MHAAGSEDETRSHFEAQDLMEHGGPVGGGWLGRFLRFRTGAPGAGLGAVALGKALPESLRGAPGEGQAYLGELARLWSEETGSARSTLDALGRIEELRRQNYRPANGAEYPPGGFGRGLFQIAGLIKARVGLEAATIDLGGWDSHLAQSTLIDSLMDELAAGLAAFHRDLGTATATTSVVVMTEFGRRVQENASLGTDHGRGSVMLVAGGGVAGGRVVADWPGLAFDVLAGPGDLPVFHNYRDVLAAVLSRHGAGADLGRVFPSFELHPLDL